MRPIYSETSIAQILMALKCPASLKLEFGPLGLFCDEITLNGWNFLLTKTDLYDSMQFQAIEVPLSYIKG